MLWTADIEIPKYQLVDPSDCFAKPDGYCKSNKHNKYQIALRLELGSGVSLAETNKM